MGEEWKLATLGAYVEIFGPERGAAYDRAARATAATPREAYDALGRFVAAEAQGFSPRGMIAEAAVLADEWASRVYADAREEVASATRDAAKLDVQEGAIRCRRCGGRKTYFYQMQTRSADEGMTTYFICTGCGNRWKG